MDQNTATTDGGHLMVRHSPAVPEPLEGELTYVLGVGPSRTTIRGRNWHRVERHVGEALRGVPLHDLAPAKSPRRFDVLTSEEFDELALAQRARLDQEAADRARSAAEAALRAKMNSPIEVVDATGAAVVDATGTGGR